MRESRPVPSNRSETTTKASGVDKCHDNPSGGPGGRASVKPLPSDTWIIQSPRTDLRLCKWDGPTVSGYTPLAPYF